MPIPHSLRSRAEWLAAALLVIAAACAVAMWHRYGQVPPTRPDPIQMTLRGDDAAMGSQHGKQEAYTVQQLMTRYLRGRISNGDGKVFDARCRAAWAALPADSPYTRELQALADAAKVPVAELAYGNAFVDMGDAELGCRSVVLAGPDGLLHGHNLDWDNLAGLGTWSITVMRRFPADDRYDTVAIAFPGMVGTFDVINEHGVALSYNLLGPGRRAPAEPLWIGMRRIAETCDDFASARKAVLALPAGMGFFITLSDASSGEAAVFERDAAGRVVERAIHDGRVGANNTAIDHRAEVTPFQRALHRHPATMDGMIATLRSTEIIAPTNLYSVIWDYRGNRLMLASGIFPAARSAYREFELFARP